MAAAMVAAKQQHDRIIRNHANLNNKKFLIPDNVEKYIVNPMKRWYSKPNYIILSLKHPTPAQKNFHSMEWDKELEMQEQNGLLSMSP